MRLYIHDWRTFTNVASVAASSEAEVRAAFRHVETPQLIVSTSPDPRPFNAKHVSMCVLHDSRFNHDRVYVSTPGCNTGYMQSNLYAGRLDEAIDLAIAALVSGFGPNYYAQEA